MLFVRKLVFNSLPKQMSSGGLVRPRSPLGLRPAGGNGASCSSQFIPRARALNVILFSVSEFLR